MRFPLALLAMLGFVLSTVFGTGPSTQAGVQCPTATVQTVTARDCCGRLVTRAPRPGEKEFKQCRCAERKAGSQKATVATKVVLFLEAVDRLEVAVSRKEAHSIPNRGAFFGSRTDAPSFRPPASA